MRLSARIVVVMIVGALLAFSAPVRAQECGDGVVDPGETCDPPNLAPGPNGQVICRLDCTSCGDGVVQSNDVETCDVGPLATCGSCLGNCNDRIFNGESNRCPCGADDPSIADIRANILAACPCGSASSHRAFVSCAREQLALVPDGRMVRACRRTVLKCLAHSACGKQGAVACCRTDANGRQRCQIRPDAARCTAPTGGSASVGASGTCCDACP